MEHAKSQALMQQVGASSRTTRKQDDAMDVGHMNKEEEEKAKIFIAHLQSELEKCAAAGDWEGTECVTNTLYQFSNGKTKGKCCKFVGTTVYTLNFGGRVAETSV